MLKVEEELLLTSEITLDSASYILVIFLFFSYNIFTFLLKGQFELSLVKGKCQFLGILFIFCILAFADH